MGQHRIRSSDRRRHRVLPTVPADTRAVVLVEGVSDQVAVETAAARRHRDLSVEGVAVLPIGGATNIGHFLGLFGPRGLGLPVAGLCDAAEERIYRRGLERAGLGTSLTRPAMETLGFFVCVEDLEDELIRAGGADWLLGIVAAEGELGSFRIFRTQPAQRSRPIEAQLRRFLGTRSGRKIRYAGLLVDALETDHLPPPLAGLLSHL